MANSLCISFAVCRPDLLSKISVSRLGVVIIARCFSQYLLLVNQLNDTSYPTLKDDDKFLEGPLNILSVLLPATSCQSEHFLLLGSRDFVHDNFLKKKVISKNFICFFAC